MIIARGQLDAALALGQILTSDKTTAGPGGPLTPCLEFPSILELLLALHVGGCGLSSENS